MPARRSEKGLEGRSDSGRLRPRQRLLEPRPWRRWPGLVLALATSALALRFADLQPRVSADFFFSTDDPQLQQSRRIRELFPDEPLMLVSVAAPDIRRPTYGERILHLAERIRAVPGVAGVHDLRHGPRSLDDALNGPFWRRALIAEDESATNILVDLDSAFDDTTLARVERIARAADRPDFDVAISGVPYVVERLRGDLMRDLRVFGGLALGGFTLLLALLTRSAWIVLGAMTAGVTAAALTLLMQPLLGLAPGVLTPNIPTIVFVLTLSHIVFITGNRLLERGGWRNGCGPVRRALWATWTPSFWAMLTTLLGFLLLTLTPAKPVREFGLACVAGSAIALVAAYAVYPPFLIVARPVTEPRWVARAGARLLSRPHRWAALLAAILVLGALPGIRRLDTDPSLPSYFESGGELREGVERVDRTGGSGDLQLVVEDAHGAALGDRRVHRRLGSLQAALERDPDVGRVLSLAVLQAEARRPFWSFLLSRERLLKRLESPKHAGIGRRFVSADRRYARFQVRMRELGRELPRDAIVGRLQAIVRRHGFRPALTGGLYLLSGQLSRTVVASMLQGLAGVAVLLAGVGPIVSRSLRTSLAMLATMAAVPVCVFGAAGYCGIPLDVIAMPATIVALVIGIDDMIHLSYAWRRSAGGDARSAWFEVRTRLWRPVVGSSLTIAAGFSIFLLSATPPTRRFGGAVVSGTCLSLALVLFVFPLLAARKSGSHSADREAAGGRHAFPSGEPGRRNERTHGQPLPCRNGDAGWSPGAAARAQLRRTSICRSGSTAPTACSVPSGQITRNASIRSASPRPKVTGSSTCER